MRRTMFIVTTVVLSLATTAAFALGPITRQGVDYSGLRNPGYCEVEPDGPALTDLHVKCTAKAGGSGPDGAYVRYRFLKDVGAVREDAYISADLVTWVGKDCFAEWMVKTPESAARTLRVTVPWGSYCHIRSVSWSQP